MLFRWFENSRVYHPMRPLQATGAELGRPYENVFFQTSDGVKLNGWFYPAVANSPRSQLVFLNCHGNGGNISHRLGLYQALLNLGASVFAPDYRGYGASEGSPSEEGTYLDAQAAYQWLRQKGFAAQNIIAYGESLGGAITAELCMREQTGGLVLQSTFTSIPEIGRELYPWLPVRLLSTIKYDTCRKLSHLKIPVLIMHSKDDGLVGFRHSQENFAAANEPKFFCELRGSHNDEAWESPGFDIAMDRFLEAVQRPQNIAARK